MDYQKRVNEAAGELSVKDPSLLTKRGRLFELAQELVHKSGYAYMSKVILNQRVLFIFKQASAAESRT